MATLTVPNAQIRYEVWGESGPWLTLVNGHNRTHTDFRAMGRFFSARAWRVLVFDNRGSGETKSNGPFSLAEMASDIAWLWNAVGCEKSHLLGISLGGAITMAVTLSVPVRVKSLILVSTTASKKWLKPNLLSELSVRDLESALEAYFSPRFVAKNGLLVKALAKETAKAFQVESRKEGSRLQRAVLETLELEDRLSEIRVPTLVIHGDQDRIIPVESGKRIASLLPDARLEIFPGAGHLLLAESAQQLYAATHSFCQKTED